MVHPYARYFRREVLKDLSGREIQTVHAAPPIRALPDDGLMDLQKALKPD
jgi:hypothetical protein